MFETVNWNRVRVAYGSGPLATVYGWPAIGGIYGRPPTLLLRVFSLLDAGGADVTHIVVRIVLKASAAEIEFLGYERFKPVPHPSPATPRDAPDEDAHCTKSKFDVLNGRVLQARADDTHRLSTDLGGLLTFGAV